MSDLNVGRLVSSTSFIFIYVCVDFVRIRLASYLICTYIGRFDS
jgi:hypothetical protein